MKLFEIAYYVPLSGFTISPSKAADLYGFCNLTCMAVICFWIVIKMDVLIFLFLKVYIICSVSCVPSLSHYFDICFCSLLSLSTCSFFSAYCTVRPSSLSGGYNHQAFRPYGPASSQWGSRGPHHAQFSRYDQQRGPFPSQNSLYPTPSYGNYPPQEAPRGSFGPSWEQRPTVAMQAPSPQENCNYGQPQGADHGQPDSYSQTPVQHYGHGYGEQAPVSSTQAYGQNVPPQHSYPYASSAPMQQNYPPYGSVPAADGYNHPSPATASSAYPQQAAQLVAGYGLPGGPGLAGGYPYRTPQPGYTEKPAANNAVYGYQAQADLAYGSAQAPSAYAASTPGQLGYGQPAPTQPGYDRSIPQPAGEYADVPMAAGYGKSASPQPVYP
ncbi:glutenin, high molecular weight subunit DX5-like [Olea europaea var. sylvestris]|uniref:glutenin, high molecular weight subunit DX5-like n=1 Tax=Olea europaea var. sylvestris TaxID=158386 RepID=UPI000C1D3784|nr:glutenin, high molecular weight subunit DX5-like [Olea europaea var. sylvestris]